MTSKLNAIWTTFPERFVTWGYDNIALYEIKPLCDAATSGSRISKTHVAELIAPINHQQVIKCLDVTPRYDSDLIFAIGYPNGKVKVINFAQLAWDSKAQEGKELTPKFSRSCNSVVFNKSENNLLGVALDKYKPDNCISIWDLNQVPSVSDTHSTAFQSSAENIKPLYEIGPGEQCEKIAWFSSRHKALAASMNMKHLRIYDLRDATRPVSTTLTKGPFGVCINPKDERYLASYFDTRVFIWDTRSLDKPVQILPHNKPIANIAWCPTKNLVLTTLQKDSFVVSVFDVMYTKVDNEEVQPTVLERVINPGLKHAITSFAWHPTDESRIIYVSPGDKDNIIEHRVIDRIAIDSSVCFNLSWSYGKKIIKRIDISKIPKFNDISLKIKGRTDQDYGLNDSLSNNSKMVEKNEILANVWNWLHATSKLVEATRETFSGKTILQYPGILSVLNPELANNASELITVTWADLGHSNCAGAVKYFKHEDRDKALLLCSWTPNRTAGLENYLNHLETAGAYTRAAAIAVFNLRLQLAIDILYRAPKELEYGVGLNIVAMALSGFSNDPNSVWKKFCTSSVRSLTDPYLKAMFAFLTADGDYDFVLDETDIVVDDRVALACIYLPDHKLMDYMKKLNTTLYQQGNLDGLLLTGNGPEGLKLLQKYLDVTGDIQSTTLIAVRGFHHELSSPMVQDWIANYRELLNSWKMWTKRAEFDLLVAKYKTDKPPPQIYISCSYCGKNISTHSRNLKNQQYSRLSVSDSANKLTACPHCRKPLARCTLCLLNMGAPLEESNATGFDTWFTWCQNCRHGGHSKHVIKWFEDHSECAQVGCDCRCFSLDHATSSIC